MLPKRDGRSKHAPHRSAFHAQSAGLPQMVHLFLGVILGFQFPVAANVDVAARVDDHVHDIRSAATLLPDDHSSRGCAGLERNGRESSRQTVARNHRLVSGEQVVIL